MAPEPPDTRQRLLDAARELFLQQGYAATGVAQILAHADARSGSLYHFFPTKEDLLLAVLQQYRQLLWPLVIQPVFQRISDPLERIFGILDGYRQMLLMTDCRQGCPIGNLALEISHSHPAARELVADNFRGWIDAIRTCLDDVAGRLPCDLPRAELATFVLTTMEGGVMLARAYGNIEPFDSAVTQLRDYFERLLEDGTEWSRPSPGRSESKSSAEAPAASSRVGKVDGRKRSSKSGSSSRAREREHKEKP